MGLLVVSHYERFYELLKPTHAHVLINGAIVMDGDERLIQKIDTLGYDWIESELGIEIQEESVKQVSSIGLCGVKQRGDGQ